jgi:cytochrome c-type biogenesis protein CcmH
MKRLCLILAMLLIALPAQAVQPNERLADPVLEARAREIGQELRCLVCQNQSIDDSDAPLAHDLRALLRERLTAGDSDAAAKQYIVARYGDYVLLRPPLKFSTLALWLGPLIFLFAAVSCVRGFYRTPENDAAKPLTAPEKRRLASLTGDGGQP